MTNEELQIIISAQIQDLEKKLEKANKEVSGFSKGSKANFEKFNKAVAGVGKATATAMKVTAGAIAAGAAALVGLSESTKDYRVAQAKLTTAFETAGSSAEQAKTTYNQLYRVLGDSDVAVEAAGHLAKLTTEEEALADYTKICQGVYATFGDSLAIEGLTEAVNHTAKLGEVQGTLADALEWSGVSVDEFNEQLFWCNTEAEREALIRNTLNDLYGESAENYEKNAAGILSANEAQAKLTESLAQLGAIAEPIVTIFKAGLADALATITPHIGTVAEGLQSMFSGDFEGGAAKLQEGITGLVGSLLTMITEMLPNVLAIGLSLITALLEGIIQAFPSVITTIVELLPQVIETLVTLIPQITGAILNAIPLLLEAATQVVTDIIIGLAEILPTVLEQIVSILPQVINAIINAIPLLLEAAIQLLMAIVNAIPLILPPLIQALPQIINNIITVVLQSIPLLINAAINLLMAIVNAIPQIIPPLVEALPLIIDNILSALVTNLPLILDAAIKLLMAVVNAIPKILPPLVQALPTIITKIIEVVIKNIPLVLDAAIQLLMAIIEAIPEIIPPLISAMPTLIISITKALIQALPQLLKAGVDLFMQLVKAIPKILPDLLKALGSLIGNAIEAIGGLFSDIGVAIGDALGGSIKKAIQGVLSSAIKIINGFIKAINIAIGVINLIPKVNIKKLDLLEVPKLAKGGIVDSATLALVGEQGKEAVMPLENNLEWLDKLAGMLTERLGGAGGGNQPIYLMVDKKVLAETSIRGINDITRQTGAMPLVIM